MRRRDGSPTVLRSDSRVVGVHARIAYLHGFNSSPASIKGQLLARAIEALPIEERPEYLLPRLSHRPRDAVEAVARWIERGPDARTITLVGSSLGGFYATYLAERYGSKAVLVNPALHPGRDLVAYVGLQRNLHTGEEYDLRAEDVAELAKFGVERITDPQRYLLLVQTGDEILDYRVAVRFYAGAWQCVQGGGDHGFQNFAARIPTVLRFAEPGFGDPPLPDRSAAR